MDSPLLSEAEILAEVERAKDGDTAAFGRVYDHFFAQVYRYSAFRLPPEIAEDVVADIFVKAWEKLHTYRSRDRVPFSAWLFRIARHCVIDAWRTQKNHEEVPEQLADTDHLNNAEFRLQQAQMRDIVRQALDKLPGRYREVLLLTFIGDLSHQEAARVLRLTEGAVRILKMRALRKLEALLPPDLPLP